MATELQKRVRSARDAAGLTQQQVAEKTGIDDSSISKFENGQTEPRLGQLEKLSEAYHLPLGYFFGQSQPGDQVVRWRKQPSDTKEIESRFLELCRRYHQLEIWTGQIRRTPLPPLDDGQERFGYPQAQKMATDARNAFRLGDRPGQRLAGILGEVYGVRIFHMDIGDSGVAGCAHSDEFGNAILLNKNCTSWRRNFDLAHELFHLLTWERFGGGDHVCRPDSQQEKLATCFAGNLLLPEEIVKNALEQAADESHKIGFSQLDAIAREFDVSLESLFWRMHFLYNWEEQKTKQYILMGKDFIRTVLRNDTSPPELLPERYRALAIEALQEGKISVGRFAQFMDVSRQEAQRFVTAEEASYAEIPATVA